MSSAPSPFAARIVNLGRNESPLGPSPRVRAVLDQAAEHLNLYPEFGNKGLEKAIAEKLGRDAEEIVAGPGCAAVMEALLNTFCAKGSEVILAQGGYPPFLPFIRGAGAVPVEVPLTLGFRHALPEMARAVTARTSAIIVCNPNNPTGTVVSPLELNSFLEKVPPNILVVVDEAYAEYAAGTGFESALGLLDERENVVVLRSFSKAYALAGLRVGYGVAGKHLTSQLRPAIFPYSVSRLAQLAAAEAIFDTEHVAEVVELNRQQRVKLYSAAQGLGLQYIPSYTNFVCLHTPFDGSAVVQGLARYGYEVRSGAEYGMRKWIRVSTGSAEAMDGFISALAWVLDDLAPIAEASPLDDLDFQRLEAYAYSAEVTTRAPALPLMPLRN